MKKRLLIVEDEPGILELLTLLFMREGYEVHTCASGRDAIARINEVHPHLIVLDVMLPGMDGTSIVKVISQDEALSSIPVIVTSALLESEKMFHPYPQVKGFCSKPFVIKEMLDKVKQAIGDE